MARRNIDMLPLLDIFMVVLFVFATIQEGQLDDTSAQLEQAENAQLAAEITAATESLRAATQYAELTAQLTEYQLACGPRVENGPVCPAAEPATRELVEVARVHEELLSKVAVFEVVIVGERGTNHALDHCCIRPDPPIGEWRSCGVIPRDAQQRADWFDDGGEGLRDLLRATKDGYAIVLVEQDLAASYQVGSDLALLLKERLRNHYIHDNGVSAEPLSCDVRQ